MGKRGVPHEPTEERRDYVRRAVAAGLTQLQISAILDVSLPTLERHYRRELDVGAAEMMEKVASRLYQQALSDSDSMPATVARIFIAKARGGWRETVQHADADGGPLNAEKRPIVVLLPSNGREVLTPAKPPRMIEGDFIRTG